AAVHRAGDRRAGVVDLGDRVIVGRALGMQRAGLAALAALRVALADRRGLDVVAAGLRVGRVARVGLGVAVVPAVVFREAGHRGGLVDDLPGGLVVGRCGARGGAAEQVAAEPGVAQAGR